MAAVSSAQRHVTLRIESLLTYYKINSILTSTEGIYDHVRMSYVYFLSLLSTFWLLLLMLCCAYRLSQWFRYYASCNLFRNSFFTDSSDLACFYSLPTHGNFARYYFFILQGKIGKKKKTFLLKLSVGRHSRLIHVGLFMLGVRQSK